MTMMRTLSGLWAGDSTSMQILFAAVSPDSVPPAPFLRNRFETHKKHFFSVKLAHRNRTQALVSFVSDSLGPIFIPCNVCSLPLGTEKKMLPTFKKQHHHLVP